MVLSQCKVAHKLQRNIVTARSRDLVTNTTLLGEKVSELLDPFRRRYLILYDCLRAYGSRCWNSCPLLIRARGNANQGLDGENKYQLEPPAIVEEMRLAHCLSCAHARLRGIDEY